MARPKDTHARALWNISTLTAFQYVYLLASLTTRTEQIMTLLRERQQLLCVSASHWFHKSLGIQWLWQFDPAAKSDWNLHRPCFFKKPNLSSILINHLMNKWTDFWKYLDISKAETKMGHSICSNCIFQYTQKTWFFLNANRMIS